MLNSVSIIEGMLIVAGIITIASAFIWVISNRYKIWNWFAQPRRYSNLLGIRRIHRDRKQALQNLLPKLQSSKKICIMNLRGASIVEESDLHETLLYKILEKGETKKEVNILIHFPDSKAFEKKVNGLGEICSFDSETREHQNCIKKIEEISAKYPGQVLLRYFSEPNALWNILTWDKGLFLGWYEKKPSHKAMCLELNRDSTLGRQFEQYFNDIWSSKSMSKEAYENSKPVYPDSSTHPQNIIDYEKFINLCYGRKPTKENAFVILIGGGAGTGKSTLAWQLSQILGVRNVISTDNVRQLLRVGLGMLAETKPTQRNFISTLKNIGLGNLSPNKIEILLAETWEAWHYIDENNENQSMFNGLTEQAEIVSSAVASFAEYNLEKGMPTIIEGIHILPNENIMNLRQNPQFFVFFIDTTPKQITTNFTMRRYSTHMREVEEQFAAFDARVQLKAKILELAHENDLPVISAGKWDDMQKQAMDTIMDHYTKYFMAGRQ